MFFLVSGSLVCYNCLSKKSLADCEDNQAAVLGCQGSPKNESRCYIFESISETGEVSVGKNCIGQHMCRNGNGCHRQAKQCTVRLIFSCYKVEEEGGTSLRHRRLVNYSVLAYRHRRF